MQNIKQKQKNTDLDKENTSSEFDNLYLAITMTLSRTTQVSWYQNVSILDFAGAKDDGAGCDN